MVEIKLDVEMLVEELPVVEQLLRDTVADLVDGLPLRAAGAWNRTPQDHWNVGLAARPHDVEKLRDSVLLEHVVVRFASAPDDGGAWRRCGPDVGRRAAAELNE